MANYRSKPKQLLSQEELHALLWYEPDTGRFYWRSRDAKYFSSEQTRKMWNTRYAGTEAFTATLKGYKQGNLLGNFVQPHRVAWKMIHNEEPPEIDHINGNPLDNRIDNLRAVDRVNNMRNAKTWRHNTSGHTGVSWHSRRGKWRATIRGENKKSHELGFFERIEDAVAARKAAEAKFGFHPNHGRPAA